MTAEQWEVDKTMREYEEYGERVQSYLLFLMGGMSGLSQYKNVLRRHPGK